MTGTGRSLSDAEALIWSLDSDPTLRSSFMGITLLDRPLDWVRFRRRMLDAGTSVPALRERVVSAPLEPRWEVDPDFDLDHHLRRVTLPGPGDRRRLLDTAATLDAEPFDRDRPLWRFTVVDGLDDGGCALLSQIHHVMSDGIGAVRISVSFLDLSAQGERPGSRSPLPEPATGGERGEAPAPGAIVGAAGATATAVGAIAGAAGATATAVRALVGAAGATATAMGALVGAARSPLESVPSAARSLGGLLALTDRARSPLWSQRSHGHRFDIMSFELERLRAVAKSHGGTINDAFVTIMAAGAGEYHRAHGRQVDELRISMPISVRHDKAAGGNAWLPTRVLVPTGALGPAERFALVSARLAALKRERSLSLVPSVVGVARRLPRPVLVGLAHRQVGTVDFACSNIRGAPFDLWIAGSHVTANHPMGPTAGVAFNATVLSYKGSLDLGINSDTAAISDPDLLVGCIDDAARRLLQLA